MKKTISNFKIDYYGFIDPAGNVIDELPEFANDKKTCVNLYYYMYLTRLLDKKAINLQRTGKMGTYPSTLGQEAIPVGIGNVLEKNDVMCPYYRDRGALIQRGVSIKNFLCYWGGDERGSDFAHDADDFPAAVPIATQCLHAAGIAYAIKYRRQNRVVLVCLGDGGTSEGDFYEAINFAGNFNLPLVFVINNNQWAISVPRAQQTKAQTLAQKAIAAGFDGVQVDGNDVIAVRAIVKQAVDKARQGKGPTLIEAVTYRLCDHTTADDAKRYSDPNTLEQAELVEPLKRMKAFLMTQHDFTEQEDEQLIQDCQQRVDQAVEDYLNLPPQPASAIFDYLYAELPKAYRWQRDEVIKLNGEQ